MAASGTFRAKFQQFMQHPAGPKTIHFWAPLTKWGLVLANINDLSRPAEKLSVSQSGALTLTGVIWTRYATQIIPKNWSLFSVNLFIATTGGIQVGRALYYQYVTKPALLQQQQQQPLKSSVK